VSIVLWQEKCVLTIVCLSSLGRILVDTVSKILDIQHSISWQKVWDERT
jgi:hypothetical protein